MVRCGHCKGQHRSVVGVRLCAGQPQHEDPCRCGPYDRCREVRMMDAMRAPTANAALRARHRAYND